MDQPRPVLTTREEKELLGLRRRRIRQQRGRFLAEGVRLVEDLLASSLRVRWLLASSTLEDSERGTALLTRAAGRGLPVRTLGASEFTRFAETAAPQGVLAVAEIPRWQLDDLADRAATDVVLVLDGVQDPGNVGTVLRSAEALGAAGVIALPGTVDAWNPKTVRAAMGSSFRLPVVEASWEEARAWLRERGYAVLTAAAGGEPVRKAAGPTAVVVGNEGAGVAPALAAESDAMVGIPLKGRAESLNVAAAAAILLYELTR